MRIGAKLVILPLNLLGISLFIWPFYIDTENSWLTSLSQATWLAAIIALAAIGIIALKINSHLLDSKIVALVAVLVGLIAALRLLGAGAVGIEPMWFLLILAARAFGPEIGYTIAILSISVSALITGGIGPWLPFQVFAAGWVALGVSLIPKFRNFQNERIAMATYGFFASLLFGALMDLQLWPWLLGTDTQLSYLSGAPVAENLSRFFAFHFATAMAWDLPRAVITASLIILTSRPILFSLRRAQRRLSAYSEWRKTNELAQAQRES